MSETADDGYYDDDMDSIQCPRCGGWGIVSCYCGGDLCVCHNYGDAPCPLCIGEGTVSEAREQQYLNARQKWWDDYKAAVDAWQTRQTPPPPTAKRSQIKAARKQNRRRKK